MVLHTISDECCVVSLLHLTPNFLFRGPLRATLKPNVLCLISFNSLPCHPPAIPSEEPTISGPVEEPEPVCVARGWRVLEEH